MQPWLSAVCVRLLLNIRQQDVILAMSKDAIRAARPWRSIQLVNYAINRHRAASKSQTVQPKMLAITKINKPISHDRTQSTTGPTAAPSKSSGDPILGKIIESGTGFHCPLVAQVPICSVTTGIAIADESRNATLLARHVIPRHNKKILFATKAVQRPSPCASRPRGTLNFRARASGRV
jgi:hypothetical protein